MLHPWSPGNTIEDAGLPGPVKLTGDPFYLICNMEYLIKGIFVFLGIAFILRVSANKSGTSNNRFRKTLIFSLPIFAILWMAPFIIFKSACKQEPGKDLSGKIVSVFGTSYVLDDGTSHFMGRRLKGLAVQDSVHSYINSATVEYFKRDSTGAYREILWTKTDNDMDIYEWYFKK